MDNKVTIKEIEMPYVLVGAEERKYELLCEFQAKDGAFQRAYVQDNGKDVIIEIGKDSAIVGLFSVDNNKVRLLFDYIEAVLQRQDGLVCWCSGEFEKYLEQANKDGGKYPLIRTGIGLDEKVPMFYRQKPLDKGFLTELEAYKVSVEYIQEGVEEDMDDEMYFQEPDDAFDSPPKVTQAACLPKGWNWVDYPDGSGHLASPDGMKYFEYDRQPYYGSGNIEYRETEAALWGPFFDFDRVGSFSDFREEAELVIAEKVIGNSKEEINDGLSIEDDLNSGYEPQGLSDLEDEETKVRQAGLLPVGWNWVDYPDLSGHLEAPDGKKWFQYDIHHEAYVEFKRDDDSRWSSYPGLFGDFKNAAEKAILEHVLEDVGGLSGMDKMRFYVIDDLKSNFSIEYFDDIGAALERFQEAKGQKKALPALGVRIGDGSLDLVHGVNGEAVLVPDYRHNENFSEPMKAAEGDIQEAVRWLVLEAGNILYEYQNDIMPAWIGRDVTVLVPVTLGDEPKSSYCEGKVLKTELQSGIDAIDSLYIEMHGWVGYNELIKHPEEYVADGVIKVPQMNVVYVQDKNVVGMDGRMDIAPCDFKAMVNDINKPYSLIVYDGTQYTNEFRNKHDFIVASYDDPASAVKGWYELQERKRVPALVQNAQTREVLFNGYDENDQRMSIKEAAKKFGFNDSDLDARLSDAVERAGKPESKDMETDLDI